VKIRKLVFGIGINDADYVTQVAKIIGYREDGRKIRTVLWTCPYYLKWCNLLRRCYNEAALVKDPTYRGCYVVPEWHYFMTFRAWMEKQEWEGKSLDKDLLIPGNKEYGPNTCLFLDKNVNTFLLECQGRRGEWPIGVYFDKQSGKFKAQCRDNLLKKTNFLGYFNSAQQGHEAWLAEKLRQAYILAAGQSDERIAKALIDRYENYQPD